MRHRLRTYIFIVLSVNILIALVRLGVPDAVGPDPNSPDGWLGVAIQDCDRFNNVTDEAQLRLLISRALPAEAAGSGFFNIGPGTLAGGPTSSGGGMDYSKTNVQVEGVDEDDIVKTDGMYIYTISGNDLVILRAYPTAEATIVARIHFEYAPVGLFIDGGRLIVILSIQGHHTGFGYYYDAWNPAKVEVRIYNIVDRSAPFVVRNASVDGSFVGARMIHGNIYVIASFYAHMGTDYRVVLPSVTIGTMPSVIAPSQIGWFDGEYGNGDLTTVLAMEVHGDGASTTAFIAGGYGTLYVSQDNIYFATVEYHYVQRILWEESYERTVVHKISFKGLDISYVCSGEVPGRILNQFSMDEYEGKLRVATTGGYVAKSGGIASNNVYILDSCLAPVGKLEGIAHGEQIHSSRFLGARGYLVTFKKIDPFFVIDLSDSKAPRILGYLKIPGFSEYLHPYDENHVIGLGKDTVEGEGGGFAWYQGIKLSLFDVTDVEHPKEIAKYVIGDRGTDSEALGDHRSFMFDAEKGVIAFPVNLYEIAEGHGGDDWTYGTYIWQGVYVFSVSLDGGFALKGRVTHGAPGASDGYYWRDMSSLDVKRTLFINDALYTVSESMVKMNSLADMSDLGEVNL